MKWKKIENVTTETVYIEKASAEEQKQSTTALNKLHESAQTMKIPNAIHFNQRQSMQNATICYLNNAENITVNLSANNFEEQQDNVHFETENLPFFWDSYTARLCKNEDGKSIVIANFRCELLREREEHTKEGIDFYIEIALFFKEKQHSLLIKKELYCDAKKEILKAFPQCYVYDTGRFHEYLSWQYGNFSNKNIAVFYKFGGWYKMPNEKHIYLNNTMTNVSSSVTLQGTIDEARQFLELFLTISSEHEKILIILHYSLWAYLSYFYEICGIDGLKSVLYLSAPTGTGKTTIAKIVSSPLLNEGEKSVLRFEDTLASLQESLFNNRDIVSLVDDFYPQSDKNSEQAFKAKASMITRIAGDGVIKGKMGANRKPLPDRKYRGGIIATGEYIDLNTHSSYLRCWCANLRANSVDFSGSISVLQGNPKLARAFFSSWILWLQKNQDFILQNLKAQHEKFLTLCKKYFDEPYPRFSSNVATFLTINYFFDCFCRDCIIPYDMQKAQHIILSEAKTQLEMLQQFSPTEIVIQALKDAVDNAYLNLAETEADFCSSDYDGFCTDKQIVIITAKMEAIIEKYVAKMNFGLKFTTALKEELIRKNILEAKNDETNFKFSKTRLVSPKRPRIYKLKKGAILNEQR